MNLKKKCLSEFEFFYCPNELPDVNWAVIDGFTKEQPILRPAVVNRECVVYRNTLECEMEISGSAPLILNQDLIS